MSKPLPPPKDNCNYCDFFHQSTVPIWIENIAPLYVRFRELKRNGITELQSHLEDHPEEIIKLASCIEVVEVNEATAHLYGAENPDHLLGNLQRLMGTFDNRQFAQAMVAIWNQERFFKLEAIHYTLDNQPFDVLITARIPRFDSDRLMIPVTVMDITSMRQQQRDLQDALDKIKTLEGIVPICAACKKIRDDQGFWNQLEQYITEHTEAQFTHGICPDCAEKLYPPK